MVTTPFGPLWLHTRNQAIIALSRFPPPMPMDALLYEQVKSWLAAYFQGVFLPLDPLPLAPIGTPFQLRVWRGLMSIPPGYVESYGTLAHRLQTSPRAVGNALAVNPMPILIPCHRIIAAHGLGGYSGLGGIEAKKFLLRLEGIN